MICPNCKKETSSLFRQCQNCNADLEQYRAERKKAVEGTGDYDLGSDFSLESSILNFGPIGGILLMLISVVWFFVGLSVNRVFFYPPILFLIGVFGFVSGINRSKRRKLLKEKREKGEFLD